MRNRWTWISVTLGSVLALGAAGCGTGDDASTQPPDGGPPSDATVSDAKSDANDAAGDVEHADAGSPGDAGDAGDVQVEDAPRDAPADG